MKNITLSVLIALSSASALPVLAQSSTVPTTSELSVVTSEQQYSDAELDSILAPIALYPDSLLTHILIAATYPLDVVAADRWRQSNQHLTPEQVENVLEGVTWDPSVKALAPFADLLNTMAKDLEWLQQLGDNVLISQARVLDRVQVLRQHAHNTGNLVTNDYIEVETERQRDREIIYIEPRQREVVYVPYYNPHVVYGHWWHATAPIFWSHRVSYHHHHNVYWAPRVRLSTAFYFGGVHWHNRHVVIHRTPVRRYYHGSPRKRVISNGYQRWEHRTDHRRARYSSRVVHSAPARYQHKGVVRSHTPVRHSSASHSPARNVVPPKAVTGLRQRDIRLDKAQRHTSADRKQNIEHALKRNQDVVKQQRPSRDVAMAQLKRDKRVTSLPDRKAPQRVERAYSQPKAHKPQRIETSKPQPMQRVSPDSQLREAKPERKVQQVAQQRVKPQRTVTPQQSAKPRRIERQTYSAKPQTRVSHGDKSSQRKFSKD